MPRNIDLRVPALLASRLCHELAGALTAVGNGAELLEAGDPALGREAAALVRDSARKANARLQFYRFAFGFAGSALTGPPPDRLAAGFFAGSAIECDYRPALRAAETGQQKLACLMLSVASDSLPRGGRLVAEADRGGIAVDASGPGDGPSPEMRAALLLAATAGELSARTIGGYYAALTAEALGLHLSLEDRPAGFRLGAAPIPQHREP